MKNSIFSAPSREDTLRIAPMGGCGEFGMNITAYLYRGRLYVVDCGVRFPDAAKLGTDAIIPHVDPFFSEAGGVDAYILTHGHEDHIGALPHILSRWPAPVYGTEWTLALVRLKLARLGLDPNHFSLITVDPGDRIVIEGFDVEYIHVNHSIPMTCALFIRTDAANVFHTGDFKFDEMPVLERPTDWERIANAKAAGVDLLITDSTNAEKTGVCPGEASVLDPLVDVLRTCKGAALVSTFASNLWRLKIIADACVATGRRLYVAGAGVEQTLAIAKALGLYDLPEGLRVTEEELSSVAREQLLILATGCQGEWRSALARIAAGQHRAIKLTADDTVILSSRIIPGNEKAIFSMLNNLLAQGVRVITTREAPGIHVSGHAYGGDLERLISALAPRHYTPMHGGFSQMLANRQIGGAALEAEHKSRIMQSGDVLDVSRVGIDRLGTFDIELRYVDSESAVVLPPEVLRERLKIGELGAALVTGAYSRSERRWLAQPRIELIGLAFPKGIEAEAWLHEAALGIQTSIPRLLGSAALSIDDAFEEARISLRRKLAQVLKKKPVTLIKLHVY